MYVVYRRKGFQDYPVSCFKDLGAATEALGQHRRTGDYYFLLQEDDDSYAVQRLKVKDS